MRQQVGLLKQKLSDEQLFSDDLARQCIYDYMKSYYGQLYLRILMAVVIGGFIIVSAWLDFGTVKAVSIATAIVLGGSYLVYASGGFKSLNRLTGELNMEDIEEMRRDEKRRRSRWFYAKYVAVATIGMAAADYLVRFFGLLSGGANLLTSLLYGFLLAVMMACVDAYYYPRNQKKLLGRID